MKQSNDSTLPKEIEVNAQAREQLTTLVDALKKHLGDQLVHLSVYGSAVRDEWIAGVSDINILVLVDEAHFDALSSVAPAFAQARKQANIVPMIMTSEELQGAADVFCVKFASIKTHHVTIVGDDPLSNLQVDTSEMRFVCEFQLRNVAMRMRQFYLQSWGKPASTQDALLRFFTASIPSLRALARLKGHTPDAKFFENFDAISSALDKDTSILNKLAKTHRQKTTLTPDALESFYEQFNALMQHAVHVVDALS